MTYLVSLNQLWQCLIVGVCPIQTQDIFLHIIKGLPHFIYLSNILSFFFLSLSPSLSLSSHPVEPYLKQELVHARVCGSLSTDSLESGWNLILWKARWAKVWMRVCVCALVCVPSVLRMCCVYHLRFLLDVTAVAVGTAA